jgi:hypothetical protein
LEEEVEEVCPVMFSPFENKRIHKPVVARLRTPMLGFNLYSTTGRLPML